jgi:drug/metabolite transporter (DMT)-like permease
MASARTAYLLLLGMAVCFGGTWPAGKLAVEEVPPFTVAAVRFAVATVLLALWAGARHGPIRAPGWGNLPLILAMGATAVAGYNIFFLYGLELAPASDGAIIVPGFAPVFTVLLGWAVLREGVSRPAVAGLVLAFAGLVFVVDPGGSLDSDRLAGAGLFVAGAVCWAIYLLIGRPAIARFGAVTSTLYATATGLAMLIPFSLAEQGWSNLSEAGADGWLPMLYLAVFGTVLAFVLFYEGVSRIGPARAASFAMLVPIFGVLASVVLLGEELAVNLVIGGVAIIAGLWLIQRPPAEPSPAARPAREGVVR